MLDGVLGEGNSEVRVNAELDFDQIESTTKIMTRKSRLSEVNSQ